MIGGPNGDSGLTGRKIIVDTYGGYTSWWWCIFRKRLYKGGSFSSICSKICGKNIVAAELAAKCRNSVILCNWCTLSASIMVDTFGTGKKVMTS